MAEAQPEFQPLKVFVCNLPLCVDNKTLADSFGKFGDVTESKIVFNKRGKSMRYGFVTFSAASSLENCLQAQPHFIDGAKVNVHRAIKQSREAERKTSVSGTELDNETTKNTTDDVVQKCQYVSGQLVENFGVHVLFPDKFKIDRDATVKHFSEFGKVSDCKIPLDGDSEPKRYCIIKFKKGESAVKAIEHRNQCVGNTSIVVSRLFNNEELDKGSFNRNAAGEESRRVLGAPSREYDNSLESFRGLQGPLINNYGYMSMINQSQTSRNAPRRKSRDLRPYRRDNVFRENYPDQRGDGFLPLPFAITDQTELGCAKSNFGPMRHGRLNYTDPRTGGF